MPPKQAAGASGRGRPKGSASKAKPTTTSPDSDIDPFASENDEAGVEVEPASRQLDEEPEPEKTIPRELLTRILHEFFAKDATRISKDANAAVGKYIDVFVKEAIARTAVEKKGGFLEVEDLEKVAPQLLLDL